MRIFVHLGLQLRETKKKGNDKERETQMFYYECLKTGNKGKERMGKKNVSFTYVWK